MTNHARVSAKAVVCLVLGLLSFVTVGFTGILAAVFGVLSIRDVNASEGRLRGKAVAWAGMITGGIGLLIGLAGLLSLVLLNLQAAAHRAACQNNLREIGLAVNDYLAKHGQYPPGTLPNGTLPPERRLSWMVGILPSLPGEKGLSGRIDRHKAWDDEANLPAVRTRVRAFVCPAASLDQPDLTSYVGLAGVGKDAAALSVTDPKAGAFGYDRRLTQADVTRGVDDTLAAVETGRENGPWAAGGAATVRALDPGRQPYVGPGRPFGGLHPGGMNALFLSGSARFFTDSTDPALLESIARIHE